MSVGTAAVSQAMQQIKPALVRNLTFCFLLHATYGTSHKILEVPTFSLFK
jgi:hypothetical protein